MYHTKYFELLPEYLCPTLTLESVAAGVDPIEVEQYQDSPSYDDAGFVTNWVPEIGSHSCRFSLTDEEALAVYDDLTNRLYRPYYQEEDELLTEQEPDL